MEKLLLITLHVFKAPEAIQAQYRAAPGYEWSTYGLWDAENRRRGAAVSYFINKLPQRNRSNGESTTPATTPDMPVAGGGSQPTGMTGGGQGSGGGQGRSGGGAGSMGGGDSVMVRIYNNKNELIRSLKWRADSGYNRQYWGMEEKGFRQPGSPKPRPGAHEPGGFQVLPGTYKVVISLARDMDSTFVTVKDDPRIGNKNEVKLAQRKMYDRLRKSANKLTEGMDRLTEAEEVCTKMQAQLRGVEGKEVDSLRKTTTAMQDSLKSIREFISGKTSDRQGISRPPQIVVTTVMQQAMQYIGSKKLYPEHRKKN